MEKSMKKEVVLKISKWLEETNEGGEPIFFLFILIHNLPWIVSSTVLLFKNEVVGEVRF